MFRARYSAFTKTEIETAFNNLVILLTWLPQVSPGLYRHLIWGAVLTRYLTTARFGGPGQHALLVVFRLLRWHLLMMLSVSAWHLSQKIVDLLYGVSAPEDDAEATFKMVHQTANSGIRQSRCCRGIEIMRT